MLNLYRRHEQACKYHSSKHPRQFKKCNCPIWIDWKVAAGVKRTHKTFNTRDWRVAQLRARELEADGVVGSAAPKTIEEACKRFIADRTALNLAESSLYKYELLFKQLKAFAAKNGLVFLAQLGIDEARAFRESWPNRNLSACKKLEHLRAFFNFCRKSKWIKDNPAEAIEAPQVDDPPVMPFTEAEMGKILAACDTHPNPARAIQLRALVLLMRHSGLRIGDACTLSRSAIKKDVLELDTTKTGTHVHLPLRPEVIAALAKIPSAGEYYFWTGTSKRKTCINDWESKFQSLFQRAGIEGHSHRLRHTFAARSLASGMSMGNLSTLLGHQSIKVTEKYYSKFDKTRQAALDKAVRDTWQEQTKAQ